MRLKGLWEGRIGVEKGGERKISQSRWLQAKVTETSTNEKET